MWVGAVPQEPHNTKVAGAAVSFYGVLENDTNDCSEGLAREAHILVRAVVRVSLGARGVSSVRCTRSVVYGVLRAGPNNRTVCPPRPWISNGGTYVIGTWDRRSRCAISFAVFKV